MYLSERLNKCSITDVGKVGASVSGCQSTRNDILSKNTGFSRKKPRSKASLRIASLPYTRSENGAEFVPG